VARVEVLLLGTGDAFASGGRLQTCFSIQGSDTHVLLDCGPSVLVALRRHGLNPSSVDTILLTHLHGDHFGGVPFFLLDARFSLRNRLLTIAGPPGLEARIHSAMDALFPGSVELLERLEVRFVELSPAAKADFRSISVVPYEVIHASGAPAYALRMTVGGKTIAYSGDTEWTDTLVDAAKNADLFICEATSFEKQIRYHLSYRTLKAHQSTLGCRRLIITHMGEDVLQRRGEIDIEQAEDGKRLTL